MRELIQQHFVIDTSGVCKSTENSGFVDFGISADIFDKNMASQRPGRYLETFLEPAASLSPNMSPYRAMATPVMPKTMVSGGCVALQGQNYSPKMNFRPGTLGDHLVSPWKVTFQGETGCLRVLASSSEELSDTWRRPVPPWKVTFQGVTPPWKVTFQGVTPHCHPPSSYHHGPCTL